MKIQRIDVAPLIEGKKRLHFVGIGGAGMFPLVEILKGEGYEITGSDVNESDIVARERAMGIPVAIGHDAANVGDAELLVATAALIGVNPEVEEARRRGIPVIPRADMLGYITSRAQLPVCISGTHGKTTTTAMLTSILVLAGRDPSAVIGGKLPLINGYGRHGKSPIIVVEACEYVDTFLHLDPAYSVILNVDDDHLDYFGSLAGVVSSFNDFAKLARIAVVANGDDANTIASLAGVEKPIILFGERAECDYRISDIARYSRAFYSFRLSGPAGELGVFELGVPGRQNVSNAAAAAAIAAELGCSVAEIATGLKAFKGAGRRFEFLGEARGVTVADDYGHHPAEIKVTLEAAQQMGYRRVWAVFQPFTFSRTKQHLDEFASALSIADNVVMTEIMGSREINTYGIYTQDLADHIPGSVWFDTFEKVARYCSDNAESGDLVLTLGCGDVYKVARMILRNLQEQ